MGMIKACQSPNSILSSFCPFNSTLGTILEFLCPVKREISQPFKGGSDSADEVVQTIGCSCIRILQTLFPSNSECRNE